MARRPKPPKGRKSSRRKARPVGEQRGRGLSFYEQFLEEVFRKPEDLLSFLLEEEGREGEARKRKRRREKAKRQSSEVDERLYHYLTHQVVPARFEETKSVKYIPPLGNHKRAFKDYMVEVIGEPDTSEIMERHEALFEEAKKAEPDAHPWSGVFRYKLSTKDNPVTGLPVWDEEEETWSTRYLPFEQAKRHTTNAENILILGRRNLNTQQYYRLKITWLIVRAVFTEKKKPGGAKHGSKQHPAKRRRRIRRGFYKT